MFYFHHNNELRSRPISVVLMALMLVISLASCNRRSVTAEDHQQQKTFASPADAGAALFEAAKNGDHNALLAIFGPDSKDFVSSGDAVKDKNAMQFFTTAYTQMNRWAKNASGAEILYIGATNFAFPIPLEQKSPGQWAFNTAAGKDEILARRIGDGELTTIGMLTEIANAQQEYFSQNHQFAQKFVSDEGQKNGLYWPVAEGQKPSPLGHLADVAKALGYSHSDKPQPFNGYYYKMLTQQADKAKGGAKDYVSNGKMTGGFALLAWPATYQDSGIMTFMVGPDGVIYQKDLGKDTGHAVTSLTAYDPSEGWAAVLTPDTAGDTKAGK